MNRRPTIRGVSLLATSSLLALALLGPAGARAALPSLIPGSFGAPATVSDGGRGAVALTIYNNDKSTVSQLFLDDIDVVGGDFVRAYPSQGTCTGPACTLGQLKPKKTATVYVVFDVTTGVPADSHTNAPHVDVSGVFNTTGIGSGSDDASHGDAWPVSGYAIISDDAQDFSGRFIDDAGNLIIENDQILSDANPHATKVVAPKSLIGVSVEDGTGTVTQPCYLTEVECEALFGDESIIDVAQGGTFPGGFMIIISFDKSEIVGANANTLTIYHTYDDTYEIIDTRCTFAPNSSVPKTLPCLTVDRLGGGDLQATIWTIHNGIMRGGS